MGLCKCPKRKVTQQFCFEHKVNVCEHCTVVEHGKCIIQPYLQWLEDSSYEPKCRLCRSPLTNEDCIRLTCYHIFHVRCINNYALEKPPGSDSSSYVCPDCRRPLFPASNISGPIRDQIRDRLANQSWAKVGLNQSNSVSNTNGNINYDDASSNHIIPRVIHNNPNPSTSLPISVANVSNIISNARNRQSESHIPLLDVDEDKYRVKPASEFVSRWFRNRKTSMSKQPRSWKSWTFRVLIILIGVTIVVYFFLKLGRDSAARDVSLDPAFNPNIRVGDE